MEAQISFFKIIGKTKPSSVEGKLILSCETLDTWADFKRPVINEIKSILGTPKREIVYPDFGQKRIAFLYEKQEDIEKCWEATVQAMKKVWER